MAVATRATTKTATKKATKRADHKGTLRAKREEILGYLSSSRDDMVSERAPDDQWGLASQTLLEDLAVGTIERQEQMVAEIDEALTRIEKGTYGECVTCGDPISARRLKALPEARYCLHCAEIRQAISMN